MKSEFDPLFFFLLHLSSDEKNFRPPGRYPARCPSVFGLSSLFVKKKRLPDLLSCKAKLD